MRRYDYRFRQSSAFDQTTRPAWLDRELPPACPRSRPARQDRARRLPATASPAPDGQGSLAGGVRSPWGTVALVILGRGRAWAAFSIESKNTVSMGAYESGFLTSDDGSACPKLKSDRDLAGQATRPRKETPFRAWRGVPPPSATVRAWLWVHLAG